MAQLSKNLLLFIFFLLLLPAPGAVAQDEHNIKGQLTDAETRKALAYATVVAVTGDGMQAASAICHPDGRFSLRLPKRGNYTLWFTFVGYQSRSTEVDYGGEGRDLGNIALKSGVEVPGVTVKAQQLVRRESDRLVYDVASDPDAKRMKMLEIMSKIPELKMDPSKDGELAYENEPIVQILIDDRESGMINKRRQYPMNFIRADYMSKVELILPGSPEFNNKGPILLITLDRPFPYGLSGQLGASAETRGTYNSGINMVANTPWTGIGVGYSMGYLNPPKLKNSTIREMLDPESEYKTQTSNQTSWSNSLSHNLDLNLFRSLFKDKIDLNLSINTSKSESDSQSDSRSQTLNAAGEEVRATTTISQGHSESPMRLNAGFSMGQKWGGERRKSNYYTLKYTYRDHRDEGLQAMSYAETKLPDENRNVATTNGSREHNLNFKIRLTAPRGNWFFVGEAGYIHRHYDNATEYHLYDPQSGMFHPEPARFDGLDYRQQVAFAQLAFGGSFFKKKFSYSLQLQGEELRNEGVFLSTGGSKLDYHEFNVLPGVGFSLRLKKLSLGGGYSTRVRRPGVAQLNPYVDETDPENLRMGNPHLKGDYAHSFHGSLSRDFASKWFKQIGISYSYSFTNDAIERITNVNDDNISTTTYANIGRNEQQGVLMNMKISPLPKWTINLNGSYSSTRYEFSPGQTNTVNSFFASLRSSVTLLGTDVSLGLRILPNSRSAQSRRSTVYPDMDLILSRSFKKQHLNVSIFASDLLRSSKQQKETIGSTNFIQYNYRQVLGRKFSFSVSWQFGKYKNQERIENKAYDMP